MNDKNWARNCLRHNRNTALLSLAAASLLNSDAVELLRDRVILVRSDAVVFNPEPTERRGKRYEFPLTQIADEYREYPERYKETLFEFYKSARRVLLKESFEVVKAYAKAQGYSKELIRSPWYQFARVVRNAISHDFHFRFNVHDIKILPVAYGGISIDRSLDEKPMANNILTPGVTFDLYHEFVKFVEEN